MRCLWPAAGKFTHCCAVGHTSHRQDSTNCQTWHACKPVPNEPCKVLHLLKRGPEHRYPPGDGPVGRHGAAGTAQTCAKAQQRGGRQIPQKLECTYRDRSRMHACSDVDLHTHQSPRHCDVSTPRLLSCSAAHSCDTLPRATASLIGLHVLTSRQPTLQVSARVISDARNQFAF